MRVVPTFHAQQAIWPRLRRKTAQRLRAFTDPSRPGVAQLPCRLPGCEGSVAVSLRSRGSRPWFHSDTCARTYRQLGGAIDAAIVELAAAYEASAGALPIGQRNGLKADLSWFLALRQMYAPLGEWRDRQATPPFADPAVRRVLALDS